jgi:hypothetical protein
MDNPSTVFAVMPGSSKIHQSDMIGAEKMVMRWHRPHAHQQGAASAIHAPECQ